MRELDSKRSESKNSILDGVGDTPLLTIDGIHVKCEHLNPSGSIKDRTAMSLVGRAEQAGLLNKGDTIVEASTGNMGTALAMVGAVKGYRVIIFIAEGLSQERYKMMRAFGAEIRTVPAHRTDLALKKAIILGRRSGYFHPNQFANPWNIEDHDKHLGQEILAQLGRRRIDAVVAAIGTGGTLLGLARACKRINPKVLVFGVEPTKCALTYQRLHTMRASCRPHRIEGIADGFVSPLIDDNLALVDDVIRVTDVEAIEEAKRIARSYGCFVGVSSGANLLAARLIKQLDPALKDVVTVFPDEGEKYLSEKWFSS